MSLLYPYDPAINGLGAYTGGVPQNYGMVMPYTNPTIPAIYQNQSEWLLMQYVPAKAF